MIDLAQHLRLRLAEWIAPNLRAFTSRRDALIWLIAIIAGLVVACAAILFRLAIGFFQLFWLGYGGEQIVSHAQALPWWVILAAPATGGLVVGLILTFIMPGRRAEGIADVIEAQNLGSSRIPLRRGLTNALIAAISLGSGASAGREGPVVHMGASLASALCVFFRLPQAGRRTILACGAAAAVSASFNAPIAGVLFAHEVILGHYALSAFVPIVLSSAGAAIVSRLYFGDFPAFVMPAYQITSLWEFPAFVLLGLTCAAVAILFQFALIGTDWVARHITMPLWLRPVTGGLMVGAIAIFLPQVLGVGYEATNTALTGKATLFLLLILIVAKTAATAITLASRFGGGVFSPALYLGAMTGAAFGLIAQGVFPDMASSNSLYAILGMGAVAAAVLGAPISTTMIVFELTGGLAMSLALLVSVSIASALTQLVHGGSYFYWQLTIRGIVLHEGPHRRIARTLKVADFMRMIGEGETPGPFSPEGGEAWLTPGDTLESALRAFAASGLSRITVIDENETSRIVGFVHHVDALAAFNASLIEVSVEEHR